MEKIVYYDIEASDQWASYCDLTLIGYQYEMDGELSDPQYIRWPEDCDTIQTNLLHHRLGSPEWLKVSFNGVNYDDMVLARHEFHICTDNRHDVYLMAKTVSPTLPAYGLKFINWFFFKDIHRSQAWMTYNQKLTPAESHESNLVQYNLYDVVQTRNLFKLYWPLVQKELHWKAYNLELDFGPVLHEIMLNPDAGDWVRVEDVENQINELSNQLAAKQEEIYTCTQGVVDNANSRAQVALWLRDFEGIELELSDKGNFRVRQSDLLTMLDLDDPNNDQNHVARLVYDVRTITKQLGYLRGYRRAATLSGELGPNDRKFQDTKGLRRVPKSYSSSRARTRRILSSSKHNINFQNSDHSAKLIQLVPVGWLGCWLDQTQIENVVHIWASGDWRRRHAYEADPDWNEYVWLASVVMGKDSTRADLESIPSPTNPHWSVYKHLKTVKLAMNFFMGVAKFCRYNRIPLSQGQRMFDEVHRACPAIKQLLYKVKNEIANNGYIQDPFGHIYSGSLDSAYKIVAYFIQGCGTGSVTKAISRAIYDTLHPINSEPLGVMTGILHDETSFRIRSSLSDGQILQSIKDCLYDSEQRFSHMFDNIPLRAKLSLSVTNTAEAEYIDHRKKGWEDRVLAYVNKARELI